jgi:hypothetical protein
VILGTVVEGDSLAHVLYRPEAPGSRWRESWHVSVLSLRRAAGARWVLLLNRDIADPTDLMDFMMMPPIRGQGQTK